MTSAPCNTARYTRGKLWADPVTEAHTIVRTLRTNLGKPIDHDTWRKVLSPAFVAVMAALPRGDIRDGVWWTRETVALHNCHPTDRRPVDDEFIDRVSAGLRPAIDWLLARQEPAQGELLPPTVWAVVGGGASGLRCGSARTEDEAIAILRRYGGRAWRYDGDGTVTEVLP